MKNISIYNTYISPLATAQVSAVLNSTMLSEGELVKEFEKKLSVDLGIVNPVALNSGTTALHLGLILANVKPGDEVIIPAQTFVATGLAVLYMGAIPVFADIDYTTGNIDPISFKSKITEKTKAVIPVHWAGYPCEMDQLQQIASQSSIKIIEDAAHALGAQFEGKAVGSISDFTCFSFQAIKHITTGDGGAIACKNESDKNEAIVKRWFGIDRNNAHSSILGERQYNISEIGYKYHLNDYGAALGIANLDGFKERLQHREKIAKIYINGLKEEAGIQLFNHNEKNTSSNWLFGFHVDKREDFILALKNEGIGASVIHQRIDRNSVFGGIRKELVNQAKFDLTQIHIPIHDNVTIEDAQFIVHTIKKGW